MLKDTDSIFSSPSIMSYIEKYSIYLDSLVYTKNKNYEPKDHENILNEKLFKNNKIQGIGLFVSEGKYAGLVIDDIKIEI